MGADETLGKNNEMLWMRLATISSRGGRGATCSLNFVDRLWSKCNLALENRLKQRDLPIMKKTFVRDKSV